MQHSKTSVNWLDSLTCKSKYTDLLVSIQDTLKICYAKYMEVFGKDSLPIDENILHEMLIHYPEALEKIKQSFSKKAIYRAYIMEYARYRDETYPIRWWRRDWYATGVKYAWKVFCQKIGQAYKCPTPNCRTKASFIPALCLNHDKQMILTISEKIEYKSINSALSELIEAGITTYLNLRILDLSKKSAVQPVKNSFKREKGWPIIILAIEKHAMFTDEWETICNRYGIIPYASSGQSTGTSDELLMRILQGECCIYCFKHNNDITDNDNCGHSFYDERSTTVYLFTVTDYDPTGFSIANTFANHFSNYTENLIHHRLGVTKEQIDSWKLEQYKFFILKTRDKKWSHKITFPANSEAYGLEMDNIPDWEGSYFFDVILPKIIDVLGIDGWTDFALAESKENLESEVSDLTEQYAKELASENDPDYLIMSNQIHEINAEIVKLVDSKNSLKRLQDQRFTLYLDAIRECGLEEINFEEEDYVEREKIDKITLKAMHSENLDFWEAVRRTQGHESVLDNDLIIEELETEVREYETEILDETPYQNVSTDDLNQAKIQPDDQDDQ